MAKRKRETIDRHVEVEGLVGVANTMIANAIRLAEEENLLVSGVDPRVSRSLELARVAQDLAGRVSGRADINIDITSRGSKEEKKPKIVGDAWWE